MKKIILLMLFVVGFWQHLLAQAQVPDAPTNLVATGINTGGMIQFTSPASDGGSSITNYEYSIDNGSTWITPSPAITSSPLNINSGLTNCTSYQVKIRAVNAIGSGSVSSAVQLIPATFVDMGVNWTQRASAADNSWRGITYGNGLFVAVAFSGTGNRVMTSPDGLTWTARTSAGDNDWRAVTYGNGLFVAVSNTAGTSNQVMTSPDGITWTARTSAADNQWFGVTYGNGLFVAVASSGTNNRVMTSQNGINWTARTSVTTNNWRSVTYGNGLFVAVANTGTNNRVMTSSDGITWTARTSAANNGWNSVTYGNGLFVAVALDGINNRVMTSTNGINWTTSTSAANNQWFGVTYGNGLFVAVANTGSGNRVMTSANGTTWTARTSAADNQWHSVAYGNGLFVAVALDGTSNRVMTSTYNAVANPPVLDLVESRNGGARIFFSATSSTYAPATSNYEYSTDDGVSFTSLNPSSYQSPITIGNLTNSSSYTVRIRAVNSVGVSCASSPVSVSPSVGTIPDAPTNLVATGINNGGMIQFTAPASDGGSTITNYEYSIDNGATWITPTSANNSSPLIISSGLTNCASYQIKIRAVNIAGSGTASAAVQLIPVTSVDMGVNWTQRSSTANNEWTSVNYGNGMFVAVAQSGAGNRVMTSSDGINWTARTPAVNNQWVGSTFGNGLFVAVSNTGTGNRVMTSSDGITWKSQTSSVDIEWRSVTYGNGLFVAVATSGTGNRVMTSPDAINWTTRTSAEDNEWRGVTYGNGRFVAVASTGTNRVMTSSDGITWATRTAASNEEWRDVTYGNSLFVAVATSGTGKRVMTSTDGTTWASRASATNYNWRGVTYGNGLFVVVGNSDGNVNQVMTSPDGIIWTARTSAANNSWVSVTYGNGVFVAVSNSLTGNLAMSSSYSVVANAPVVTSATFGNSSSVNFTQSASSFAPTITNYEYSTDNGSNWVAVSPAATTSPLTIAGLATVPTSILIRAVNSVGNSCPSNNFCVPPSPPTASAQTFCGSKTVADLVATGTDLKWYDVATNGTALASTTVIATGTYYVTQTLNSCESNRTSVIVTVNNTSAPTATAQTFCGGKTVADLVATGTDLKWYDVATNGTALASTTAITSGTYYVSQTLSSCESNRTSVTVTVNNTSPPTASTQTFIGSKTVADLVATGTDLKWYDVATNGTALASTTAIATGTYYVSQTLNSCESIITSVTVTVNISSPPTASTQTFIGSKTVADLVATGTNLKWYDVATNGTALASTTAIATGTYYVSQTLNSCESDRTSVSVTVAPPSAPGTSANLVATGINTGGMIQFTAPTSNGGSTITNYEYSIDNGANWITPSPAISSSPLIISSGLTNCTSYQVKIRAVNANGFGTASAAITLAPSTSNIGVNWTLRTTPSITWTGITYGNGQFVAVASDGTGNRVMTSPDGINWTARTPAADNLWQSVTYGTVNGNGLFVAVSNTPGASNQVMTSPDGINWTARTSAADKGWKSVTYGNGLFVAVANSGTLNRVMTSPDGINWTAQTSTADNNWISVTHGNGVFVAVASTGTGNRVMTSEDGITWTARNAAVDNNWRGVTYGIVNGNGLFVAVANTGNGNRVMTSPDGINWTAQTSAVNNLWSSVTFGNGLFVAIATNGTNNRVMSSPDGITWTSRTSAADLTWNSITYGNGMFAAVASTGTGNRVMTSTYSVVANPPVINTVESRNGGNARVFFTASSSTYAPSISNYEYSTDDGVTFTALSPASIRSPINISGLTIGSTYAVRIRAINSVGASCVSSSMSVTIVETVPGISTNLVATGINTGGMIQFAHPNEGGSSITNYQYSLDNGQSWVTPSPAVTQSPLIISSGLTNCTSYQVKLRAVNSAGNGTASDAVQFIPATSVDMGVNWTQRASAADNVWTSVAYGNGLFVAVAASGSGNRVMTSPDGITWTARTSAEDNNWTSVTYGNGIFVAVANSGTINRVMTSPDGITWTSRNFGGELPWTSVTYGNGLFVAASGSPLNLNQVMTSVDGIVWTNWGISQINIESVTYGNARFVAVAFSGVGNRVMSSEDGITWVSRTITSAEDINWTSVTYGIVNGNGLFVAVAESGTGNRVMTSPDGITWTSRTSAADNNWQSVTYGNGLFVAVANTGTGNRVMTSPDGITWTIRTSTPDNQFTSVFYGNGVFVAVAADGIGYRVMTSAYNVVGDAPVISAINARNNGAQVIFSNNASAFAPSISNYEYSTDDGSTWIARSPASYLSPMIISGLSNGTLYNIKIRAINLIGASCASSSVSVSPSLGTVPDAPTNLVATPINAGGMIQFTPPANDGGTSITNYEYSTDGGTTWNTPSPANASSPLIISSGLTNCSSYQVKIRAVNSVGSGTASSAVQLIPATSVDIGVNWTQRTSAADNNWTSVTYGNGLFVAVANTGAGNRLMTSPDGITWTARTSAADNNWTSVIYGNGLFVAVAASGIGNRVMTSSDGITWTYQTSAADNFWTSVTYGNGLFVAVAGSGNGNEVMTSPDGITWTSRTSAADNRFSSVTYGNGLFVAVGSFGPNSYRMTSPDGIIWTEENTATSEGFSSVTYGNGVFVIVGNGSLVNTSENGITWTSRTSAADISWQSVTFSNGLFVAVANSGTGNRVMTSPDGITWTSRTSAADNNWTSVIYGNGVFVAVASSGSGNRVMTSSYSSVADAPVITSSSYSSGTAIVNFTQSTSALSPAITNYEYSTDNGSNWVAVSPVATTSPLTITGLATVPTTIMIRAVNSVGNSCPSNNFCVPPTAPSASAQTFIGSKTVADLVASGTDLKWYDVATNGTALASTTAIATGTYYVSQTLNSCESDRTSVSVSVAPPSAPGTSTNLIATGLNSGGMIQFTAPTSNGGSTITNYEYSIDNGANWITPSPAITTSPLFISSGLTNCTSYQVKIRAVNAAGSGTESAAVELIPAASVDIGVNWTARTSAADNIWSSITYGNGLFVAVAQSGTGNRVMTSPDGITWTARNAAADLFWNSVTYGNGLFVAVAGSGTGNRVMTSPDGIDWTIRTSAADNFWTSVTYGNGMFVAVAAFGSGNRVMTSSDGITWTIRTSAAVNSWTSVTYGNGLFVAVSASGTANRVMTSSDGITWTIRTSAADNNWQSVTYGNGLFVAVAGSGNGNRVMTSSDGITWTIRTSAADNFWSSITYSNGLFVAVANTGTGNRVMTSSDGITWTARTSAADNFWSCITYSNGLFVAVANTGTNNRVMTSGYDVVADAPVITSSSFSSGTAIVNFTQSASSFAPTITNYRYSTDGGSSWTTLSPASTTSPITVTGLTDFTNQIQLQAINSVGISCPASYSLMLVAVNLNKYGQKTANPSEFVNKYGAIGVSGIRATGESRNNTPLLSATAAVTNITSTTATSGGTVSADGGAAVTARGVCWSTSANPTITNSKTTDGTGTGAFTSAITGLSSGTTYYVRSYATNSIGTTYGPELSFSTINL